MGDRFKLNKLVGWVVNGDPSELISGGEKGGGDAFGLVEKLDLHSSRLHGEEVWSR